MKSSSTGTATTTPRSTGSASAGTARARPAPRLTRPARPAAGAGPAPVPTLHEHRRQRRGGAQGRLQEHLQRHQGVAHHPQAVQAPGQGEAGHQGQQHDHRHEVERRSGTRWPAPRSSWRRRAGGPRARGCAGPGAPLPGGPGRPERPAAGPRRGARRAPGAGRRRGGRRPSPGRRATGRTRAAGRAARARPPQRCPLRACPCCSSPCPSLHHRLTYRLGRVYDAYASLVSIPAPLRGALTSATVGRRRGSEARLEHHADRFASISQLLALTPDGGACGEGSLEPAPLPQQEVAQEGRAHRLAGDVLQHGALEVLQRDPLLTQLLGQGRAEDGEAPGAVVELAEAPAEAVAGLGDVGDGVLGWGRGARGWLRGGPERPGPGRRAAEGGQRDLRPAPLALRAVLQAARWKYCTVRPPSWSLSVRG